MDNGHGKQTAVTTVAIKEEPAQVGPTATFIYCCLCAAISAGLLGFLEPGAEIAIGVLQLGIFVGYSLCALHLFKAGNQIGGNVFFIFAAFFGGVGGLTNIVGGIVTHFGIPFAWSVSGIANVLSGIILVFCTIASRSASKADFFVLFFAAIGVTAAGLSAFIPAKAVATIAGVALALDGAIALYLSGGALLRMSGIDVPFGSPIFKQK